MNIKNISVLFFLFLFSQQLFAQDSSFIKVHFLYGSKPAKGYEKVESKWFGGKLGGHVGIEIDSNKILNFLPSGKFHVFAHSKQRHSRFAIHNIDNFYSIMGGDSDSCKYLIVSIPISNSQKEELSKISEKYLAKTPYDYAFFGTRCGAAAYEILGQIDIVKSYSHRKNYMKIFYPRKMRKQLIKLATKHHWTTENREGCISRNWEKDRK
ncbi:MAG: hypothetical protein H6607_10270 [Flavobacteriales bacterium]|nr:hypothetical protein [Flavobacteriales bacterium]